MIQNPLVISKHSMEKGVKTNTQTEGLDQTTEDPMMICNLGEKIRKKETIEETAHKIDIEETEAVLEITEVETKSVPDTTEEIVAAPNTTEEIRAVLDTIEETKGTTEVMKETEIQEENTVILTADKVVILPRETIETLAKEEKLVKEEECQEKLARKEALQKR